MSGSVNKVTLIGNLGKDPEIRSTSDGKEIANLSIATTESWKDKSSGEKKDKTEWHRVICFNEGLVKVIKNYVKKGTKLYLEGQLQTKKWIDKDNQEKYTTEVILKGYSSNLVLLGSNSKEASLEQKDNGRFKIGESKQAQEPTTEIEDDEILF
jgi:single-strand DNA-binding protein